MFNSVFVSLGEMGSSRRKSRRTLHAGKRLMLKQSFTNNACPTQDTVKNISEALGFNKRKVNYWLRRERLKRRKIQGATSCKL